MAKKNKTIRIQPQELHDGTLPYPYFIDSKGCVGRQDFWQGNPYKLIGFSLLPKSGTIDLQLDSFLKDKEKAIGMYAVFTTAQDSWFTQTNKIKCVS